MVVSSVSHDHPIVIVGAGFSGTLLAIYLLRFDRRVVLIERDVASLAKGLAYGTRRPEHVLNVRAANMSAFPDDPDHFLRWVGFDTTDQANRFVPRLAYGQYLRELLVEALSAAPDRIRIIPTEAVSTDARDDHTRVVLADGQEIVAGTVVLALGNFAPSVPEALVGLPPSVLVADPWQGVIDAVARTSGDVLLLGTGLTTIDVALALDAAGHRGTITALSRRGLRPTVHDEETANVAVVAQPFARGSRLLREVRRRAREVGWRAAIDELRRHTQSLWRLHGPEAQRRFLRHARPFWEAHRHRLAPAVGGKVDDLVAQGRLSFAAGRIVRAERSGAGAFIHWQPRGTDQHAITHFDTIINCTGPEGNIARIANPLIHDLRAKGRIRCDIHQLGIDTDHLCRVFDQGGRPQDDLLAVGPLTKGEAWEVTAVPDIRQQVWQLARRLAGIPGEQWLEAGDDLRLKSEARAVGR